VWISTAAIVVRNGKLLVLRRSSGSIAGSWEFPGGKVDSGESPEQALARELREELGVKAEVREELARASFEHRNRHFELRAFRVELDGTGFVLTDHDAVRWLKLHELGSVSLADSDRKLLSTLEDVLKEGERQIE
jgi:8-oxo-dGTP diphosphatase